jgi:hypothetical protein
MGKARRLLGIGVLALLTDGARAQIRNPVADSAFNGFNKAFLVRNGTQTHYGNSLTDRNRAYFWEHAYLITAAEDVYDGAPTAAHRKIVNDLLSSFLGKEKSDWKWDKWNDDIEWVVNIFIRGFQITGDSAYLAPALNNWKMVWNRGWTDTYGGGIWERMDDTVGDGKCGLSNWPFIFEGVDLYKATGDTSILDKCIKDYAWTRTHAYDPKSGRVYEKTGVRGMYGDDNSYNTGLLVNAAASLFDVTRDSLYYNDAITAASHYIGRLGASGIMTEDHPANGYFGAEQFARGLSKFARQNHLWNRYWQFLSNNSAAAWTHRRTDYDITWNNFSKNTPTGDIRALETQGSIVTHAATPVLRTLTQDPQSPVTIQAEEFNFMKGISIDANAAGSVSLNAAGSVLEYILRVPANGVYTVTYRLAATGAAGVATADAGALMLQLNGQTLATTAMPAPNPQRSFSEVSEKVALQAGIHSFKLANQNGGLLLDSWKVTFGDHAGAIFGGRLHAAGQNGIRIVSGPSSPEIRFDFGNHHVKTAAVLDLSGSILRRPSADSRGVWAFDASDLADGVYILSIRTDKGERISQRFMK